MRGESQTGIVSRFLDEYFNKRDRSNWNTLVAPSAADCANLERLADRIDAEFSDFSLSLDGLHSEGEFTSALLKYRGRRKRSGVA